MANSTSLLRRTGTAGSRVPRDPPGAKRAPFSRRLRAGRFKRPPTAIHPEQGSAFVLTTRGDVCFDEGKGGSRGTTTPGFTELARQGGPRAGHSRRGPRLDPSAFPKKGPRLSSPTAGSTGWDRLPNAITATHRHDVRGLQPCMDLASIVSLARCSSNSCCGRAAAPPVALRPNQGRTTTTRGLWHFSSSLRLEGAGGHRQASLGITREGDLQIHRNEGCELIHFQHQFPGHFIGRCMVAGVDGLPCRNTVVPAGRS